MNDEDYLRANTQEILNRVEGVIQQNPGTTLADIAVSLGSNIKHPITAIGLNHITKLLVAERGLVATWSENTPPENMTPLTAKYYFPKSSA